MARIDAYLRSIEKLVARGANLTSNQPIVLRLPDGDRNATQVVAHDQLVMMMREIAPPAGLNEIDGGRPTTFEFESDGGSYRFDISPSPGRWSVDITALRAKVVTPVALEPTSELDDAIVIERTSYDIDHELEDAAPTGFDDLAVAARRAGATELFLLAGQPPMARVAGDLIALSQQILDGDSLESDLGAIVSTELRTRYNQLGEVVFSHGGGSAGRLRVHWLRDRRGAGAAIRLLPATPPQLDRLGVPTEVDTWLAGRGLLLVAGGAGTGRSTVLAAMVAKIVAQRPYMVVTLEDPIEILQPNGRGLVSQREVGSHMTDLGAGILAAVREGANVIAVGDLRTASEVRAAVAAALSGVLVISAVSAASATSAIEQCIVRATSNDSAYAREDVVEAIVGVLMCSRRHDKIQYRGFSLTAENKPYILAGRTAEVAGAVVG